MYSQAAITVLENRIGFGLAELPAGVVVDPTHITGTSGRVLPFFHKLANLKNIYNTVEIPNMDSAKFNAFLQETKSNAVRQVLSAVLDRHKKYRLEDDYDELITTRPAIFDDAIGYTMASAVIEQIISTSQKNYVEASAKLSYQQLKMELEGIVDENGRVRAKGLKREQIYAIDQAIDAIFTTKASYEIHDASGIW